MTRGHDVLVVGGGSAGLAAALAAARAGAEVLLVERHGFLGGTGTAALVHSFCGLYLVRGEPGAVLANGGIAAEMEERMRRATGLGPVRMGRVDVLPQHPAEFVRIAEALVSAEHRIKTRFDSEVVKLERDGDGWLADVWCEDRLERVSARCVVDASGDATAANLLGVECDVEAGGRLQRPAYVAAVAAVAGGPLDDDGRLGLAQRVVDGVRSGRLDVAALGVSFRSSGRPGEVFVTIDLTAGGDAYDPLDPLCLARVEAEGRAMVSALVAWLREAEPAWREAMVACWPMRVGVRESRRWRGKTVLHAAEWLVGARYPDEIGLATWPMEFRETNRGPKLRFPEDDKPCGIPAGCLQAAGFDNLFVAGRCISVDHDVQASVRVMGTCFVTGEAAGRLAAARCGVIEDRG